MSGTLMASETAAQDLRGSWRESSCDSRPRVRSSVLMFSSRESPAVLEVTAGAAAHSTAAVGGVLDIVVNGNRSLADAMTAGGVLSRIAARQKVPIKLWLIELGDKAHAWNEATHHIAPPAAMQVFLDGYARLQAGSLVALEERLGSSSTFLAVSGLPRSGRSARLQADAMVRYGGMHGNLYALSEIAMQQLRRTAFRLPLGLYRNDGLLGAALAFGLDVWPREWLPRERIAIAPLAAWTVDSLKWWRLADWRVQLRRRQRQADGEFETAAYQYLFERRRLPFHQLPLTATELVSNWKSSNPVEYARLASRNWWNSKAATATKSPPDWRLSKQPPELCFDSSL